MKVSCKMDPDTQAFRLQVDRYKPRSCKACSSGTWTVVTYDRADRRNPSAQRFFCKSWRCDGDCRLWKSAQDFARIKEALQSCSYLTYHVLTFDPKDWGDNEHWYGQYKGSMRCWDLMRKSIVRRWGEIAYVQTWERNKNKGLHCNLVLESEPIWKDLQASKYHFRNEWESIAVASGFGKINWSEHVRGERGGLAGYLVKLSKELTG